VIFFKFLCQEPAVWLSAKKSVPSVYFFAESFFVGSRQRSHFDECFFFTESFYLALGKAFFAESFLFDSRQRREL
jgi:hypothetical protein